MKIRAFLKGVTQRNLTSPWATISVFLAVIVLSFSCLYLNKKTFNFRNSNIEESYATLKYSVKQGGFSQFQRDKNELKQHLLNILTAPKNDEEEIKASNIALYLFPDILPDTNLEKQAALEYWAPIEAAIERKPRSAESRMLFEELKSNIWNYENPKVTNLGLSVHAQETLNIYFELSSP